MADINCNTHSEVPITLRPVTINDAELIAKWFNDPECARFMSTFVRCRKHTTESVKNQIADTDPDFERLFMVLEKGNPVPIGHAGIDDIDFHDRRAEIFFVIGEKEARGKGYCRHISSELLKHAFNVLNLNSLFATVAVANVPSIKVVEKSGFIRIGVRRQYNMIDGEFMDEIFYDMTRADYERLHSGIAWERCPD